MPELAGPKLKYGRAVANFVLAYVVVTILAVALSLAIGAAIHAPETAEPMQNKGYLLSERFLPFLNLLVWTAFAAIYFRRPQSPSASRKEAVALGALWLALALVVDYVGFVLIKNPISLSPHDFYIGQFPWIYLIYIVVFISPLCYTALANARRKKALA